MTIQESVAEKISTSGETVKNTVIDKLVEVEVSKRVDTITKAISKLDTLEKEFKKINRNDSVSYINGEKVESMTDKRFQEIQKAKQVIDNLKKSIDLTLEKNDSDFYSKLNGLLGGNKSEGTAEAEK